MTLQIRHRNGGRRDVGVEWWSYYALWDHGAVQAVALLFAAALTFVRPPQPSPPWGEGGRRRARAKIVIEPLVCLLTPRGLRHFQRRNVRFQRRNFD